MMQLRFAEIKDESFLSGFINFGGIELDWTGASESWLVVERDNIILGAVQFALSRPIGHVEFVTVDQSLSDREKFKVAKLLMEGAREVLTAAGSAPARVLVEFKDKSAKKLLKKYFNGKVVNQGNLMLVH